MLRNNHSHLFNVAVQVLKFFLLFLFGFGLACLLAIAFDSFHLIETIVRLWGTWFWRSVVVLICLMLAAIVTEAVH